MEKVRKIRVVYDEESNTMDVCFVKSRKAICEEIDNGFILKKDTKGNVLGFEKLNYLKTKKHVTNLPVEVVVA